MAHIFDNAKLSSKQAQIALSLTDRKHQEEYGYKVHHVFEYGGRNFFGIYESMVLAFVKNNPNGGDFFVWLQDQELEVKFH
jgi:hypothetical protein